MGLLPVYDFLAEHYMFFQQLSSISRTQNISTKNRASPVMKGNSALTNERTPKHSDRIKLADIIYLLFDTASATVRD